MYDVSARGDASYTVEDKQPFVDLSKFNQIESASPPKIATLEEGFFWLDGTFEPFPDDPLILDYLYWSESMAGAGGAFATPIRFPIPFSESHTSIGLTFHFAKDTEDYPAIMTVYWYDSIGGLISVKQFFPDSAEYFAENPVEDYWRIEIEVPAMSRPYRYLKIWNIDYGQTKTFGWSELVSAKLLEEVDITSSEITVNQLNFTVYSRDREFSLLNPMGILAMLQRRQVIDVIETVDGENIYMGSFYLDTWQDAGDNQASMTAIDLVGIIGQSDFFGGMYSGEMSEDVIAEVLDSAGVEYALDESLHGMPIYGHIPICSHREALQQVAFAIGAVVDDSRSRAINIFPPPERSSILIPPSRKIIGGKVELKELVTGVSVTAYTYMPSENIVEEVNETLPAGEYEIIFQSPLYDLQISGGIIVESNVNRAVISVAFDGAVVLSGKEYAATQMLITKRMLPLPANVTPNILAVKQATLVGMHNAREVAERIYNHHQNRYENIFSMVLDKERAADHLIVSSLRGEMLKGSVCSLESDLTGGFISSIKVKGVRIETMEGEYTGEFYTGESVGVV